MTVSLKHTTPADGTFSSAGAVAWDAEHTLTLATGKLLGRSTAGTGAAEEISIGTGLSLSGGTLTNTVTATAPGGSTTQIQYNNAGAFAGAPGITTDGTDLTIASASRLLWSTDLILRRAGAANLRMGAADAAAPVAQTLSVQSVVAGTSNTAGANLTITGSQGTGTGAGGSIIFQVAPAGSTGTAQNALATALTIAPSSSGNPGLPSVSIGGATNVWLQSIDVNTLGIAGMAALRGGGTEGIWLKTGLGIGSAVNSPDVYLYRDAANTLALRNGTNAQTFRVYSTYTNASNYERGALNAGTDYIELAAETAGTGDDNLDVRLTPAGTGNVRFGTHSAIAAETVTGYITIKDSGGTVRKIAVVS